MSKPKVIRLIKWAILISLAFSLLVFVGENLSFMYQPRVGSSVDGQLLSLAQHWLLVSIVLFLGLAPMLSIAQKKVEKKLNSPSSSKDTRGLVIVVIANALFSVLLLALFSSINFAGTGGLGAIGPVFIVFLAILCLLISFFWGHFFIKELLPGHKDIFIARYYSRILILILIFNIFLLGPIASLLHPLFSIFVGADF